MSILLCHFTILCKSFEMTLVCLYYMIIDYLKFKHVTFSIRSRVQVRKLEHIPKGIHKIKALCKKTPKTR